MSFWKSLFSHSERIDYKIDDVFGTEHKNGLIVHTMTLPAYRFVDIYHAIEHFANEHGCAETVETAQHEFLNDIIHSKPHYSVNRSITPSPKELWSTGPNDEKFLPTDCFWFCPSDDLDQCFLIRLTFIEFTQKSRIELACSKNGNGEKAIEDILKYSVETSIYRNKVLHLAYETGKRDEYGDVEKAEHLHVTFSKVKTVAKEDIILSEDHLKLLQRNIIDLQNRRDLLKTNGVPTQRGVLFHGPPGTGKTYACRYICHELTDTTCFFVTGAALTNVGAIYSLARLLQPSILFIEDADLMFASREQNMYSTTLGELMDQMDGLKAQENISIVLTTNDIDRLESALKDRPGRISQCIYMGPPDDTLRKRYIVQQLEAHNTTDLNIDTLVENSEGATQAFIKEWVFRAVQIACERVEGEDGKAALVNSDFAEAMKEMQRFLDETSGKIIGFVERKFQI